MKVRFEEIEDLSTGSRVRFFTAILDEGEPEMEKFDEKDFSDRQSELRMLYGIIEEIRNRGAKKFFFRAEGPADALPPRWQEMIDANLNGDFGLRLYCIRLADDLLILLNGGIKTARNPLHCQNVRQHFRNAQTIARKIDKAILEGDILIRKGNPFAGFEFEI